MEEHNHSNSHTRTNLTRAFWMGIILNTAFVIIEFVAGFYYNSLSLLSDAGHNLSDVASLGLTLFAFKLSKSTATNRFTYGYSKSTILVSLTNAVILLIAVGSIGWEAIQRFMNPVATHGDVISVVAGIGIVINTVSALLFFKEKDNDLNVKGAYLHLAIDAIVSVGVVMAGILISYTGIKWIDPLVSLLIMIVVIYSTWGLLTESLRLVIDGVPANVDLDKVKEEIEKKKGVAKVDHLHIWAISTTANALTAHLLLENSLNVVEIAKIKSDLRHSLEQMNVQHATFETESTNKVTSSID